jgi:hypothetical protein
MITIRIYWLASSILPKNHAKCTRLALQSKAYLHLRQPCGRFDPDPPHYRREDVDWGQSMVRDDAQRTMRFELNNSIQKLNATAADLDACIHWWVVLTTCGVCGAISDVEGESHRLFAGRAA